MAAKDARSPTAKDRALDYVKTQVLTGEFPGGELISEGDVATALGMSRTPVREAFLRLEAEGLLRLYPQRGALVVPVSPDEVRAVMEARLGAGAVRGRQGDRARPSRLRRGLRTAIGRTAATARRQRRRPTGGDSWSPTAPFTPSPWKSRATPSCPISTRRCAIVRCG